MPLSLSKSSSNGFSSPEPNTWLCDKFLVSICNFFIISFSFFNSCLFILSSISRLDTFFRRESISFLFSSSWKIHPFFRCASSSLSSRASFRAILTSASVPPRLRWFCILSQRSSNFSFSSNSVWYRVSFSRFFASAVSTSALNLSSFFLLSLPASTVFCQTGLELNNNVRLRLSRILFKPTISSHVVLESFGRIIPFTISLCFLSIFCNDSRKSLVSRRSTKISRAPLEDKCLSRHSFRSWGAVMPLEFCSFDSTCCMVIVWEITYTE